jgi:hypothetical protein
MADGKGGMRQTRRPETEADCDELAGERQKKQFHMLQLWNRGSYTEPPCPIGITGNQQGIGALRDLT